jgi:hypothetical protein
LKYGDVLRWHDQTWGWKVVYICGSGSFNMGDPLLLMTLGNLPPFLTATERKFYGGLFQWYNSLDDDQWVPVDDEA